MPDFYVLRPLVVATVIGAALAGCASSLSAVSSDASCSGATDPARVLARNVQVPSLEGRAGYPATIYRPRSSRYRGRRPGVVLMHGRGSDQCDLSWAAIVLGRHGYVALAPGDPRGDLPQHIDAARSAVGFLRSRANPYRTRTDPRRIGLVGHSQGAAAVTAAQESARGVKAIVALDILLPRVAASGSRKVRPRVPALSLASDDTFRPAEPFDADEKKRGYEVWRKAGRPTMALVLRGFGHGTFAHQGTPAQHRLVVHHALPWLDRWLQGRSSATRRLLSKRIGAVPTGSLLSSRFRSAAFLPRRIDCEDFVACMNRR